MAGTWQSTTDIDLRAILSASPHYSICKQSLKIVLYFLSFPNVVVSLQSVDDKRERQRYLPRIDRLIERTWVEPEQWYFLCKTECCADLLAGTWSWWFDRGSSCQQHGSCQETIRVEDSWREPALEIVHWVLEDSKMYGQQSGGKDISFAIGSSSPLQWPAVSNPFRRRVMISTMSHEIFNKRLVLLLLKPYNQAV